ncbi:MAG: hypothetical protein WC379_12375 [Methanoregula sp.]|jgi:hypothetical protein
MARYPLLIPVLVVLCLILVTPATATLVLSDVSFTPNAPLTPGGQQQVVATYAIIPSGSTTFTRGHSLQMQTDLTGAQWTTQVTLDGRNAARQTASGSAAFVNGELLSYSTDHDVGIVVTIDGTVPASASGSFMVLSVEELDNGGNVVPGSVLVVSQLVAGPASPAITPVIPTLTPSLVTTSLPTRSPGFAALFAITALITAVIVLQVCFRER